MWKKFVNHFWIGGEFVLKVGRKIDSLRQIFFPLHCILFTVRTTRKNVSRSFSWEKNRWNHFIVQRAINNYLLSHVDVPIDPILRVPVFLSRYLKRTRQILLHFPRLQIYIYIYKQESCFNCPFRCWIADIATQISSRIGVDTCIAAC